MATTWLQVKEAVANNLGRTDGATYSVKREDAINRARRKFYSERQWRFLKRTAGTLTFTAQVASLPTDFNLSFSPICIYKYVSNVKYEYRQVNWDDLVAYSTLDYVYAIDPYNKTVKISQTDASLSIDYTYLPTDQTATDGTDDTDVEPAPDTTAIELLATAYFFMSSRQSKSSYQQFLDGYREELSVMVSRDAVTMNPRFFRQQRSSTERGYMPRT